MRLSALSATSMPPLSRDALPCLRMHRGPRLLETCHPEMAERFDIGTVGRRARPRARGHHAGAVRPGVERQRAFGCWVGDGGSPPAASFLRPLAVHAQLLR